MELIIKYMGIIIFKKKALPSKELDVSQLPAGIYFVKSGDRILKFVKK